MGGLVFGELLMPDGGPARGVAVQILWMRDPSPTPQQAWRTSGALPTAQHVRTDQLGSFGIAIEDRARNSALLAIEPEGVAPYYQSLGLLRAGASRDLGTIQLRRGGALRGVVRDAGGAPCENVRVALIPSLELPDLTPLPHTDPTHIRPLSARTDARGVYHMEDLPPGRYGLLVDGLGRVPSRSEGYFNIVSDQTLSRDVTLPPGRTLHALVREANGDPLPACDVLVSTERKTSFPRHLFTSDEEGKLTLGPLPHGESLVLQIHQEGYAPYERVFSADAEDLRIVLAPRLAIQGHVLDARTRAPLQGCWVQTFDSEEMPEERLDAPGTLSRQSLRHRTDALGRFRIEGHAPGTYVVVAAHASHLPARSRLITIGEAKEPEDVELLLSRGSALEITLAAPNGVPHSGATIEVRREPKASDEAEIRGRYRHPPRGPLIRSGVTEGGFVRFDRLRQGRYRIEVHAERYPHTLPVAIELDGKKDLHREEITLQVPASLHGTLKQGGEVTSEWKLFAFHEGQEVFESLPDPLGRFVFEALPPGKYRLVPVHHTRHLAEARWARFNGEAFEHEGQREFTLAGGQTRVETFDLERPKTSTLRGLVQLNAGPYQVYVCPKTRTQGVPLSVYPTAVTDRSGKFEIENLKPGLYEVLVTNPLTSGRGSATLTQKEILLEAGLNDIGVLSATLITLTGDVVDATGNAVGPGWLIARFRRGGTTRHRISQAGTFSIADIPWSGEITLEASIPKLPLGKLTIDPSNLSSTHVQVTLKP